MLTALGNIFKIPELRDKIIFTLIMFAIFRMGTHIPVPGVDPTAIEQLFANGSLFGLLDLFSGGAFSKFSILTEKHETEIIYYSSVRHRYACGGANWHV